MNTIIKNAEVQFLTDDMRVPVAWMNYPRNLHAENINPYVPMKNYHGENLWPVAVVNNRLGFSYEEPTLDDDED